MEVALTKNQWKMLSNKIGSTASFIHCLLRVQILYLPCYHVPCCQDRGILGETVQNLLNNLFCSTGGQWEHHPNHFPQSSFEGSRRSAPAWRRRTAGRCTTRCGRRSARWSTSPSPRPPARRSSTSSWRQSKKREQEIQNKAKIRMLVTFSKGASIYYVRKILWFLTLFPLCSHFTQPISTVVRKFGQFLTPPSPLGANVINGSPLSSYVK